MSEERPWGGFREFVKNEVATIKILFIKSGEIFSLQKHNHRNEFWRVLVGNPVITIAEKTIQAKVGDEFEIQEGALHRIEASDGDVEVLEIIKGEFDEADIVRIEDKYGRT